MKENRPKILGLEHLGLVAKDPEKARYFFTEILGLTGGGSSQVDSEGVQVQFWGLPSLGANLELLESTSPTSAIARYQEKRGGGIHHLALRVAELETWLSYLQEKEVPLIDEKPRQGAHGPVAFIHPRATGGILIELVQTV